MDPKDDLIYKHQDDQIDRDIKDRHRKNELSWEITSRMGSDPDEDLLNRVSGRLVRAEVMLKDAYDGKLTFNEVIYYVDDKILTIAPANTQALTIRAYANSQLSRFVDAVSDAQAAILGATEEDTERVKWLREQLPSWRRNAERDGI